ncbi:GTPase domain-containing protein [Kitasatospora phosalacinea]|uniref:GTPase domain-containing protein n=1 Tax=Kitasatospora phosalacinea TaxID=2065 RepID=UPI0035DAE9AB
MTETATPDPREWSALVRAAVRTVAGEDFTGSVTALWERFEPAPDVRVTVYGPYDAGKSSLIRRLLAEDATEPPDWLTVSARRETFAVDHVRSADVEYADTPGIAGGNAQHRAAADNALSLTDALLVVLPPQLATTDLDHIRSVATGTLFGAQGARLFPAGALVLVLGRMDEAGIDPQDDLAGYRRLCEHKRQELAAFLARGRNGDGSGGNGSGSGSGNGSASGSASGGGDGDGPGVPVHLVSADPYGLGLFAAPVGAEQDWDGIAGLRAALAGLAARRAELRRAAEVRLWSRVALRALGEAEQERAETAEALAEAERELAQLDLAGTELDGLVAGATAELHTTVRELLSSAVDTLHGADLDEVRAEAERGLGEALFAWSAHWGAELDRLVRRIDEELAARARRAAATAFQGFVGTLAKPLAGPPRTAPTDAPEDGEGQLLDRALNELRGNVRQVARSLYQSHLEKGLGMPLERAAAEIGQVDRMLGDRRRLRHYYASGVGLSGPEQAAAARTALRRMEVFSTVIPSVLELGAFAFKEIQGARLESQERQRRAELRAQLDATADAIVARVLEPGEGLPGVGWSTALAEVRTGLAELARPLRPVLDVTTARKVELASAAEELAALLAHAPTWPAEV